MCSSGEMGPPHPARKSAAITITTPAHAGGNRGEGGVTGTSSIVCQGFGPGFGGQPCSARRTQCESAWLGCAEAGHFIEDVLDGVSGRIAGLPSTT